MKKVKIIIGIILLLLFFVGCDLSTGPDNDSSPEDAEESTPENGEDDGNGENEEGETVVYETFRDFWEGDETVTVDEYGELNNYSHFYLDLDLDALPEEWQDYAMLVRYGARVYVPENVLIEEDPSLSGTYANIAGRSVRGLSADFPIFYWITLSSEEFRPREARIRDAYDVESPWADEYAPLRPGLEVELEILLGKRQTDWPQQIDQQIIIHFTTDPKVYELEGEHYWGNLISIERDEIEEVDFLLY